MQPDRDFEESVGPRVAAVHQGIRLLLVALLVSLSLTGCSTKTYTVTSLPGELHAMPTSNVRTVGLTSLASDSTPLDQISSGDVLEISFAAGLGADEAVELFSRVNDHGNITLPYIGTVDVAGLTMEEAESAVKVACIEKEIYRNPHVTVTMKQRKTVQVTVVGAVEKEGTYMLAAGSSGLLQALSLAGGISEDAGSIVEVRRPHREPKRRGGLIAQADGGAAGGGAGPDDAQHSLVGHRVPVQTGARTVKVNLAALGQQDPEELRLPDGAVVMVERRDPMPIQVLGLVHKPDIYEYPVGKNLRLLDAVALAGGESSPAADKIFVIRRREDQPEPALIQISLRAAKRDGAENMLLEPGDTVSVEQTPLTVMVDVFRSVGFNIGGAIPLF